MKRKPPAVPVVRHAAAEPASFNQQLLHELESNRDFLLMMMDMPISFHRAYVPLTGMATAALMLSYAVQITIDGETHSGITDPDGWFAKSLDQWTDEIGLSRDELATARTRLRDLGVMEERIVNTDASGFRRALQYRVDMFRLEQLLLIQAEQMRKNKAVRSSSQH